MPRIQVITRKAYGGAYVVMDSKSIGSDLAFAWPSAELAVMGAQGAVEIVYRARRSTTADPVAPRAELVEEYTETLPQPVGGGRAGLRRRRDRPGRDADQAHRRPRAAAHRSARSSRHRKHGNMPLVSPTPQHVPAISPTPTDEEAAAIVAAIEVGLPRAGVAATAAEPTIALAVLGPVVVEAGPGPSQPTELRTRRTDATRSRTVRPRWRRSARPYGVAMPRELTTVADDEAVVYDGAVSHRTTTSSPTRRTSSTASRSAPARPRRAAGRRSPRSTTCTSARSMAGDHRGHGHRPDLRGRAGRRALPRGHEPRRHRRDRGEPTPTPWSSRATSPSRAPSRSTTVPRRATSRRSATGCSRVRGNHESLPRPGRAPTGRSRSVELPGVTLVAHRHRRSRRRRPTVDAAPADQLDLARRPRRPTSRPAGPGVRPPPRLEPRVARAARRATSAINPDDSEALVERRRPTPATCAATSPATPTGTGSVASARRGDVPWVEVASREGVPRGVGRVPGVRGRHPPGPPPHLDPRGAGRGPRGPATCTPACTSTTPSASSTTAASPSPARRRDRGRRPRAARRPAGHRPRHRARRSGVRPLPRPTSAPTSSRSSGPARATRTRAMGWRDPRDDVTLWWKLAGRNKRTIALDLKDPDELDVMRRLVDTADVLVENFRPGTLERLGLGARRAHRPQPAAGRSPGSPGFGQDGPYADRPGFATLAEAMSGFAAINGEPDGAPAAPADRPHRRGHRAGRRRSPRWSPLHSGVGQVVDVNLLESLFQLMGPLVSLFGVHRRAAAPPRLRHPLLGAPRHLPHAPTASGWRSAPRPSRWPRGSWS